MAENTLNKAWLRKNGYKLKIIYSFAVVNKLNIKSKDDVLEMLQVIDPKNANSDQVEIYSKMLQLFDNTFKKSIEKRFKR